MELRIIFIQALLLHCIHKNDGKVKCLSNVVGPSESTDFQRQLTRNLIAVKCSNSRHTKGIHSSKPVKPNPRSTASSNQASREKTRRQMFGCCGKNKAESEENGSNSEEEKRKKSRTRKKPMEFILPAKYEVFVMEISAALEHLSVSISKGIELTRSDKNQLFGILLKQREVEYYEDEKIYPRGSPRQKIRKRFDDPEYHFLRLQNETGDDVAFAMFKVRSYRPGGDESNEASTSCAQSIASCAQSISQAKVRGLYVFDIGIDASHRGNHFSIVEFIVNVLSDICSRERIIVLFTKLYKKDTTGHRIFYLLGFRFNLRDDSSREYMWFMYKDIIKKKNKKGKSEWKDERDSTTESGNIVPGSALSLLQNDEHKVKLKLPSKYKTCSAKKHEILSLILSPNYHLSQLERSEMYEILLENMSEYYEDEELHSTNPEEKFERIIGESEYTILRVINEEKRCVAFAIFIIGKYYDDRDAMELIEVQEENGYRSDRLLKFMIDALEEMCAQQNVRVMYILVYAIDATTQQRYAYLGFTRDRDNPRKVSKMRTYVKRIPDQCEDPNSLTKCKSSPDEARPICLTRSLST